MEETRSGTFILTDVDGEQARVFLPKPIPTVSDLELTATDLELLGNAHSALGRLDGVTRVLPDPTLFVYTYVRKEALLSSQIEGTRSSLSEILLHESEEAPGMPSDDVAEVINYIAALNRGLERVRGGMPVSLRLLLELHGLLLSSGRGSDKDPGRWRSGPVWVRGQRPSLAEFVPPPAHQLMDYLGPFEKYLHDDPSPTPILLKAGLAHAQFETIHPLLDGNGRLGRLLITLLLCSEAVLAEPVLYLSVFFKSRRDEYESCLQEIRTHGRWEQWLRFFLRGLETTADQAVQTAERSLELFETHREAIKSLGRSAGSILQVHAEMQKRVALNNLAASEMTGLSRPTVSKAFDQMEELGIVREYTGQARNRRYVYKPYLDILSEGTEPLS